MAGKCHGPSTIFHLALTNSLSEFPGLDPGSGQDYVTFDLENGELTLLVNPDELNVKDLSWVKFELVLFMDQTLLPLEGVFISGRIKNGVLNGNAFLNANQSIDLEFLGGIVTLMPECHLYITFRDNQFSFSELSNIDVSVDVSVETDIGDPTLKLEGSLTNGRYQDGKIDLNGSLALKESFSYKRDDLTVSLNSGSLDVKIKNSEFKKASLAGLEVDVDVNIDTESGPLKLKGAVKDGTYKPERGFDIDATLQLVEPFIYSMPQITVRLEKGGSLRVKVESNEFKSADFSVVQADVDISIGGGHMLKLKGSLDGKYENDSVDFDSTLSLVNDFTYTSGPIKLLLFQGSDLTVTVKGSELSKVDFSNIVVDLDVNIDSGQDIVLKGCIGNGKYRNDGIDLTGSLVVEETFEYEKDGEKITVDEGPAFIQIKERGKARAILTTPTARIVIDLPKEENDEDESEVDSRS
ncbi:MAG: hypothetical protein ACMUIM_07455 [bacterium]